jgi:hypothetical protein
LFARRHAVPATSLDAAVLTKDISLYVLSSRTCLDEQPIARMPLALYHLEFDIPGSGIGRFVVHAVYDVRASGPVKQGRPLIEMASNITQRALWMAQAIEDVGDNALPNQFNLLQLYWAFNRDNLPVFETTHTPQEWKDAEINIGKMKAWPAEFFVRQHNKRYDVSPLDGSPNPWFIEPMPTGDEHGEWVVRDGMPIPKTQVPDAIYTYLNWATGANLRNPAYTVLRRRSIILSPLSYNHWLAKFGVKTDLGVDFNDAAQMVNSAIANFCHQVDGGQSKLMVDMVNAFEGFGIPAPTPEDRKRLLYEPWSRIECPTLPVIQVVQLTGPPSADTMFFYNDPIELDAYTLNETYEQVTPAALEELRRQEQEERRQQGGEAAKSK